MMKKFKQISELKPGDIFLCYSWGEVTKCKVLKNDPVNKKICLIRYKRHFYNLIKLPTYGYIFNYQDSEFIYHEFLNK